MPVIGNTRTWCKSGCSDRWEKVCENPIFSDFCLPKATITWLFFTTNACISLIFIHGEQILLSKRLVTLLLKLWTPFAGSASQRISSNSTPRHAVFATAAHWSRCWSCPYMFDKDSSFLAVHCIRAACGLLARLLSRPLWIKKKATRHPSLS